MTARLRRTLCLRTTHPAHPEHPAHPAHPRASAAGGAASPVVAAVTPCRRRCCRTEGVAPPPARAFVGVGANLGDAIATVRSALDALARLDHTRVVRCSSLYRSAPVEAEGPDFVNAVAELRTTLAPLAVLHRLQRIERDFGRARSVRNAPRTLDLDLLLYAEQVLDTEALTLPHPRAHLRAFVLWPLAEIDATLNLPGLGPIAPWLQGVADQRIERLAEP
jgi:2-amino-4-hydroxy-6-hydroxymethyldihydropteridine diphosphokinase